jgi:hypothetical protein
MESQPAPPPAPVKKKVESYGIKVMYPGSEDISHHTVVKADIILYEGESIYLRLNNETQAIYPARYTIIEKI